MNNVMMNLIFKCCGLNATRNFQVQLQEAQVAGRAETEMKTVNVDVTD